MTPEVKIGYLNERGAPPQQHFIFTLLGGTNAVHYE